MRMEMAGLEEQCHPGIPRQRVLLAVAGKLSPRQNQGRIQDQPSL